MFERSTFGAGSVRMRAALEPSRGAASSPDMPFVEEERFEHPVIHEPRPARLSARKSRRGTVSMGRC